MKKIYLILVMALAPMMGFSQSSFDVFEDIDDVTTVSVSQSMFRLMAKFGGSSPENQEYFDMVETLKGLKVYVTENTQVASDMKKVAESYIKSQNLIELMRVKEADSNVIIYVHEGRDEDHVEELLMLVQEEGQAVIMSLTGDIDLNQVALLTEKLNVPGASNIVIE